MNPQGVFVESADGFAFFDGVPVIQQTGSIRKMLKAHNIMASLTPLCGEISLASNAVATAIDVASQPHGIALGLTGLVNGFTYRAGAVGAIASFAPDGDNYYRLIVTDTAHGLLTGDIITINNTTDYDGVYAVTKIDADTFYIDAYWTQTRTGTWQRAASLKADVGSAGRFKIEYVATLESAGNYKEVQFEFYKNLVAQTKSLSQVVLGIGGTAEEWIQIQGRCLIDVEDGDIIWLSAQCLTDTTDFTIKHLNICFME